MVQWHNGKGSMAGVVGGLRGIMARIPGKWVDGSGARNDPQWGSDTPWARGRLIAALPQLIIVVGALIQHVLQHRNDFWLRTRWANPMLKYARFSIDHTII